jgi:hypothetical protein
LLQADAVSQALQRFGDGLSPVTPVATQAAKAPLMLNCGALAAFGWRLATSILQQVGRHKSLVELQTFD